MTVSNTSSEITVDGTGLQSTFDYDFPMGGSATYAQLIFTDTDGSTSSISSSLFSITGVTSSTGGTFTYPLMGSPIAVSTSLTLKRVLPLVQDVSISNQGNFAPAATEGGLDYLTMVTQQLQQQIADLQAQVTALS